MNSQTYNKIVIKVPVYIAFLAAALLPNLVFAQNSYSTPSYYTGSSYATDSYYSGSSYNTNSYYSGSSYNYSPSSYGYGYNTPSYYSGYDYDTSSYYGGSTYNTPSYYSGYGYDSSSYYGGSTYNTPSYYSGSTYDTSSYYAGNTYNTPSYNTGSTYDTSSYYSGSTYNTPSYYSGSTYDTSSYYAGSTYNTPSYNTGSTYDTSSYHSGSTYNTPSYYSGTNSSNPSSTSGSTYNTGSQTGNNPSYNTGGYGNNGYSNSHIGYHDPYSGYPYYPDDYGNCSNCDDDYPYYPEDDCYYDDCYDDCYYNDDCYEEEPLSLVCEESDHTIERGESVTFTARADGGTGHYSYSWSGDVSGSSRSISRSFNTTGRKVAYVTVRSGNRTANAMCEVRVEADEDLDAVCVGSPDEVEEGEEVVWRVNATGGDGDYEYRWSGDVSGSNRTERETYHSEGRKTATVRITSDGHSITRTCSIRVEEDDDDDDDDLRATCDVSPDNPETGETVTWRARASGGDGDYEYRWSGDVSGNGRTETERYNTPGRKTATVRITSDGETIRKTCSVYIDDDRDRRNPVSNVTLLQTPPTVPPGTLSSGVFLSDLPYTGVKETLKIAAFFLGLVLWSALIAYIFYKRQAEKRVGRKLSNKELIEKFKADNLARKRAV